MGTLTGAIILVDDKKRDELYLLELTSEIVAAFVSHNALSSPDLSRLVAEVHKALMGLNAEIAPAPKEVQKAAVSIRKSVTSDYLICLEDGKKFKSMKRHIAQLGMTPAEYREKWKLPADYPMVAPNYAATRSALAKSLGLGRKAAAKPLAGKPGKAAARA